MSLYLKSPILASPSHTKITMSEKEDHRNHQYITYNFKKSFEIFCKLRYKRSTYKNQARDFPYASRSKAQEEPTWGQYLVGKRTPPHYLL